MRYTTLDGLRGIAALAVMAHHISEYALNRSLSAAGSAVDFFFLLSGFVLAHRYPDPGLDYLRARVIRLYPLCLFGSVLGAALGAGGDWWPTLGLNLLGLPGSDLYPFDHPLWSIAFEAVASLIYFLAARRLSLPVLAVVVIGLAFVEPSGGPTWGWPALARAMFPFTVGVLLRQVPQPKASSGLWAVVSAVVLCALVSLPFVKQPVLEVAIFSAVLLAGRVEPPAALRPAASLLGRLSFPLYALHWPIAWWAAKHGATGWSGALVAAGAALAVSYLAARFYDEPVRRWLSAQHVGHLITNPAK